PMDENEVVVASHAVIGYQAADRCHLGVVIVLLQPEHLFLADLEEVRDVSADALVHLLPEVHVMRVERVVEIKDPGLDVIERAGQGMRLRGHDQGRSRELRCLLYRGTSAWESLPVPDAS